MNIEHKTTPIEHWIVDGKAYRLATESDVGKDVYFDDTGIAMAFSDPHYRKLTRVAESGSEFRFHCYSAWRFAYIQDDSLLTPPTKPIDWTRPVRTKDGRAVRVLCTDGPGDYPVCGYIDGDLEPQTWDLDGVFLNGGIGRLNLENAPQRIQLDLWVNVYPNGNFYTYRTRESADAYVGGRFACVKITIDCEEGEGL